MRSNIRADECLEQYYDQESLKLKNDREREALNKTDKKNLKFFGYKHAKVLRFVAQILKCFKSCSESNFEQLNIDMNFFLLLKNELSLAFLRNFENAIVTTKSAIHLYATKEEQNKQEIEKVELQMLEKILKSQMQTAKPEESKEEKK